MYVNDEIIRLYKSFDRNKASKFRLYLLLSLLIIIFLFLLCIEKNNFKINKHNYEKMNNNKLIEENFFIIDSNNLKFIVPHMFGFTVSKKGILTDNYYKKYGYNEEPEPIGAYVMIRKIGNEIRLNQDFLGSYGIFIYENKNKDYFALSNSFLYLQEFLIGKQNISINKDFSDNLLISDLCTPSIHETLIKEIIRLPSNSVININTENKMLNVLYVD